MHAAATEYGGVDILVSNAGIASASPLEDTTLALWNRNQSILATGYFLVGREAFRLMKAQAVGGSMVFIASKNGMVAVTRRWPTVQPRPLRFSCRAALPSKVRPWAYAAMWSTLTQ